MPNYGPPYALSNQASVPAVNTDLLPQAILLVDEHNVIRNLNRTWSYLYSHEPESTVGREVFRYIHPKDRSRAYEALEKVWDAGSMSHCTVRILDGASSERWSEIYLRYHSVSGKPFIALSISDIGERVGEERLLLAHHRSINSILNDLPGMVYRCRNNPDWPMEYVSEGCAELTGYQAGDIINSRKLSYGRLIIGEDKEPVWQEVQNALREHRRFELVYRIKTASGEIKWVWEKGKGIYSAEGELSGIEGFITDFGRQIGYAWMEHSGKQSGYTLSNPQFRSLLKVGLSELDEDGDLRLLLFCIHLDQFERYMAGLGYEKLARAQRYVGKTLRTVIDPEDVLYASQPNRWFIMQLRHENAVDIEGSGEVITDAFLSPVSLGDQQIYVRACIGCVVVGESGRTDVRRIIRRASRAMNTCHAAGGEGMEVVYL